MMRASQGEERSSSRVLSGAKYSEGTEPCAYWERMQTASGILGFQDSAQHWAAVGLSSKAET